ncbi:unnamed protein product, partial [Symbiodinium necroappetens]
HHGDRAARFRAGVRPCWHLGHADRHCESHAGTACLRPPARCMQHVGHLLPGRGQHPSDRSYVDGARHLWPGWLSESLQGAARLVEPALPLASLVRLRARRIQDGKSHRN